MVVRKTASIASNVSRNDKKNLYKSNRQYSDRNAKNLEFLEFDVKVTKISTVLLLLSSEESDVVEKALHHLDKFASLGQHQLYTLDNHRIYDFITKLIISHKSTTIVKKFSYKLLVQLTCVIDDCKKKLSEDDTLMEEVKNEFMTAADENLVEFSCILLHTMCGDLKHADALGRDEKFMQSIFEKFKSHDPDILMQSIRILNAIISNTMLITGVLCMRDFPFKNLQIELKNDCQEIQVAAIESIQLISNLAEHPFKMEFTSERLIEVIYEMCMNDEIAILQEPALKVFRNFCKDLKLNEKLSTYMPKFLQKFMDKNCQNRELVLSILIELTAFEDNLRIMRENGIVSEVVEMLKAFGSSVACEAIVTFSSNIYCLEEIFRENIYEILLTEEPSLSHLICFQKLINLQGLPHLYTIADAMSKYFSKLISDQQYALIVIAILEKLATYLNVKSRLSESEFSDLAECTFHALLTATSRSTKLTIRFLHLIAIYIDQESFRIAFIENDVCALMQRYLKTQATQLRVSACNFINMAANYPELCTSMIDGGILSSLSDNFECSLCSEGLERLLNFDLSLKFAVRRRLEVTDKIKSGFFASKAVWKDFMKLREVMFNEFSSPYHSVYTINFVGDEIKFNGRIVVKDKFLIELRDKINSFDGFKSAEVHKKIKILAIKVSKFLQTNDDECTSHNIIVHLSELKFKFSTSVIPLGNLIYGNSFEAALLFKALADQLNISASFVADINGRAWNEVCDGNNIVDLIFDIGEIYATRSYAAQKYLQKIA